LTLPSGPPTIDIAAVLEDFRLSLASNRVSLAVVAVVAVTIAAMLSACASAPAGPSSSTTGSKPTVTIQAPAVGTVVAVGQDVAVTGTANDTVGVDHVALFADGVSVASTAAGQPAPSVPFSLMWLATPAGPHTLQVVAYRADGTASDPGAISVVVGAGGSFVPSGSGPAFPSTSASGAPGAPGLITPPPTKKPKPSKSPKPTQPPTTTATTAPTDTPTAAETATPTPTPTPTPVPTPAADGSAPDDSATEPHLITLDPANGQQCPANTRPFPTVAVGCVWEQLSAPAGDSTDEINYALAPNTTYLIGLTSCSDTSDQTVWLTNERDPSLITGCGDSLPYTTSATPNAVQQIVLTFATAPSQVYNLYQFTVYQCQFFNCGTQ
jgi:hypothetical protein